MPRTRAPKPRDGFLDASHYLEPGCIVVIAASASRSWYEDQALYTELLVWLVDHEVKPVVIAPKAVHPAILAASTALGAEIVLLAEQSAAAPGYIENAALGIALPARKSADPLTAGIATQGLMSNGIPLLIVLDDKSTALMTSRDIEEQTYESD